MSRLRHLLVVPIAALTIVGPACGNDGAGGDDPAAPLEGVTWILDGGSIDGLVDGVPPGTRVDVRFDDGTASGTSGCNHYSGTYEVDGGAVTFGALGGTEMGCSPQSLMELEAAYLGALGEVREFRVTAAELVLTAGGVRLAFAPEPPIEPLPLVGTRWALDSLGYGGDTVASPVAGADASVVFDEAGEATGSTGCNRFGADYQVDGDAIAFGPMRLTRRACEPAVSQQEDIFQRALLRATAFTIEGDVLTLHDELGAFLVSFRGGGTGV
jgi:heat shock protein HslJ